MITFKSQQGEAEPSREWKNGVLTLPGYVILCFSTSNCLIFTLRMTQGDHISNFTPSSVPSSEMPLGKSHPQEETRPSRYFVPPEQSLIIPLLGNPHQHPPGLWRSELTAESEHCLWERKGKAAINKQLIASGAFSY